MRNFQSSVTTEIQSPVKSTDAAALADSPVWPRPRRWAWPFVGKTIKLIVRSEKTPSVFVFLITLSTIMELGGWNALVDDFAGTHSPLESVFLADQRIHLQSIAFRHRPCPIARDCDLIADYSL